MQLTKGYSDWLTQEKNTLRLSQFQRFKKPTRQEERATHYVPLNSFIKYYNSLSGTTNPLLLTSPKTIFDPRHAGPDFSFRFPADAQWVLSLNYSDLAPKAEPVFFTQYNLSMPIGCIFDPQVKNAFPMFSKFPLLYKEKETAADYNESRPHKRLTAYEAHQYSEALHVADSFFSYQKLPDCAIGAKDLLRGLAYEVAMISTSKKYLIELFQDDALWIAEQQKKEGITRHAEEKPPTQRELDEIAESLANTLRKSIIPYFPKNTLAELFKQLHPLEQILLTRIPKQQIKQLCQKAVQLANGGKGNTDDHHTAFMLYHNSFMEIFDAFYAQTFKSLAVDPDVLSADPMGSLTDRFIPLVNLGSEHEPIMSMVIELRKPRQGNQSYKDVATLCSSFNTIHSNLLDVFYPLNRQSKAQLDVLYAQHTTPSKTPLETGKGLGLFVKKREQAVLQESGAYSKKRVNFFSTAPKEPQILTGVTTRKKAKQELSEQTVLR
jgi:hypothetical protein